MDGYRRLALRGVAAQIALVALVQLVWVSTCLSAAPSAAGPLHVHPDNPRYFTDGTGRAIYLTGAHTWNNLQNNGVYPPVDYAEYLEFLQRYNHNFIRLWAWEQGGWDPWAAGHVVVEPTPFARTGPGQALDGQFQVQLDGGANATFAVESFDPRTGSTTFGQQVKTAKAVTFEPPFAGDAVLYLKVR